MPVERETIVTGGGGSGAVAAIVVVALVVIFLIWAMNGGLNFSRTGGTVDVDVPAVTVTPDGQ